MTDFEITLAKLADESAEIQKKEMTLKQEQQLFMQKLYGFLKEHGLSENFTLPELAMLAVRKSKMIVIAN